MALLMVLVAIFQVFNAAALPEISIRRMTFIYPATIVTGVNNFCLYTFTKFDHFLFIYYLKTYFERMMSSQSYYKTTASKEKLTILICVCVCVCVCVFFKCQLKTTYGSFR